MNLPHNHRLQLGHLDAVREARRAAEAGDTKDEHTRACDRGCDCGCAGPDKDTYGTP